MPAIHEQFRAYRATLEDDRRHLLERFEIVDMARKVVGVGSVGTRAFIVLLQGRDAQDPLFLQIKEATKSVLEALAQEPVPAARRAGGAGAADDAVGQRHLPRLDQGAGVRRHFYWRQLRDMKGSVVVEADDSGRAHVLRTHLRVDAGPGPRPVRRPDRHCRVLGKRDAFDKSITDFSQRYADQNEQDYREFTKAIRSGRLEAVEGV